MLTGGNADLVLESSSGELGSMVDKAPTQQANQISQGWHIPNLPFIARIAVAEARPLPDKRFFCALILMATIRVMANKLRISEAIRTDTQPRSGVILRSPKQLSEKREFSSE